MMELLMSLVKDGVQDQDLALEYPTRMVELVHHMGGMEDKVGEVFLHQMPMVTPLGLKITAAEEVTIPLVVMR